MRVKDDKLSVTMKAGEALAAGDVVYLSAAKEVKKATDAEAAKVIGVARDAASSGADVQVIIYGIATVVADVVIAVGDRLVAAATAVGLLLKMLELQVQLVVV